ncbi:hypothetical protein SCWH03_29440 [Streptomyces pacificus]|uniref:NADP-dependent oxidoreductase domain-containing protein n=1 Tax=Streptomyces pacificus TaxID=2705029 RepID=A0A6A0AV13_9ACTN|nr:hypothetical protein SCWH03_29440 [Streptomyces pacificus]
MPGATGTEHDPLRTVARAHGASPAQVRVAWTLGLGERSLAIPGTGDPAQLEENVAAGALRLADEDMALLPGVPHD